MDKKPYLKETLLCTSSLPLPPLPLPLMLLPLSLSLMPPSLSLSLLPLCVFPWFLYLSTYSRSALNCLSKILTRPDPGLAKLSRKIRCGVSERNLVSWARSNHAFAFFCSQESSPTSLELDFQKQPQENQYFLDKTILQIK